MKTGQQIRQITVQTAARLHCGLYSDHRPGGRRFQGFGLMIDRPGFLLQGSMTTGTDHRLLTSTAEDSLLCDPILSALHLLDQSIPSTDRVLLSIEILQSIPRHAGLGSGTQLALATGQIWNSYQDNRFSIAELSELLGRGKRSCIGTYGFERGGLLIDQGVTAAGERGTCRFTTTLPEAWRIVLARPDGVQGLAGQSERQAFQQLPAIAAGTLDRLNDLLDLLPSVTNDFAAFSEVLREFGLLVGETFAPVQGGRFVHRACEDIFREMNLAGVRGIAQSSWGPTMFGICPHQEQAREVEQVLQKLESVQTMIVSPCQLGAIVRREWDSL